MGLGRASREDSVAQPLFCSRATLQVLHQACEAALGSGLVPGGTALTWASHYEDRLSSDQSCLNEWMAMADLESLRPPSAEPGRSVQGGEERGVPWWSREGAPGLMGSALRPSEQEQMEQAIRAELWKVLDTSDLESITSKEVGREGVRAKRGARPGWGGGTLQLGARGFLSLEPFHLNVLLS